MLSATYAFAGLLASPVVSCCFDLMGLLLSDWIELIVRPIQADLIQEHFGSKIRQQLGKQVHVLCILTCSLPAQMQMQAPELLGKALLRRDGGAMPQRGHTEAFLKQHLTRCC